MAGFDYQLVRAILSIIRQVAAAKGELFVEALSDIAELDDMLVVTQAKRTLSSGSFHSALSELWTIHLLAAETAPELLDIVRYEVASARRALQDWEGSLARWEPANADAVQLAAFKKLVSAKILANPRLEAARLLVRDFKDPAPFERVEKMVGRLVRASGALDDTIEEIRLELHALQEAARKRERRFDIWGQEDGPPSIVRREEREHLAVRIGERLSLADLREGRLGNRQVYDEIEHAAETWLSQEPELYKLPVFWLSGRSGCGKSAALLHLAARLHEGDPDRLILWLGDRVERIGEAVAWAGPQLRAGRPVLILLDDPFTAARQAIFAREAAKAQNEWEAIRSESLDDLRSPPMLLCCGPTEQFAAAEDQCRAIISCTGHDLPHERPEDLVELASWYEARTGKRVAPMVGDVLLVQQVFEWTKGSIAEFSQRLRDRIRDFDRANEQLIHSTIAQILALNRLYVDYPASHLIEQRNAHPALEAAFITFGEENHHLDFDASPLGGVRLTHPHLANAIYVQWFGRATDRGHRRRHLEQALGAALDQDADTPEVRHAPLWSIARLTQTVDRYGRTVDPDMNERIHFIREELRQVLEGLYASRHDAPAPLEDLPVWIALKDALDLSLSPDPAQSISAAIAAIQTPQRGLRLSCHWLLAARGDAKRYQAIVADCLQKMARRSDTGETWHDWGPVAIDFIERAGYRPIIEALKVLIGMRQDFPRKLQLVHALADIGEAGSRGLVLDWLESGDVTVNGWCYILQKLLANGHCARSDALAATFLASERESHSWAFVWLALLDSERGDRKALLEDALIWIGGDPEAGSKAADFANFGWDRVWQRLSQECEADNSLGRRPRHLAGLAARGLVWLDAVPPEHEAWTRVWPILLAAASAHGIGDIEYLLTMAEERLAAFPGLPGWPRVFEPALELAEMPRLERLLLLGGNWIAQVSPDHSGWSYTWQVLFERALPEQREKLALLARDWLQDIAQTRAGWPFVWFDLAATEDGEDLASLYRLGSEWLSVAHGRTPGWPKVANHLLSSDAAMIHGRVRSIVKAWLAEDMCRPVWLQIFQSLLNYHNQSSELQEILILSKDVLDDDHQAEHARANAWEALNAAGFARALLAQSGLTLVEAEAVPVGLRASICGRLLREGDDPLLVNSRDRLVEIALNLMKATSQARTWIWLLKPMGHKKGGTELSQIAAFAEQWLTGASEHDQCWDIVYLKGCHCRPAISEDPFIRRAALKRLSHKNLSSEWPRIWRTIGDAPNLLASEPYRARAYLALSQCILNNSWIILWNALYRQADEDGVRRLMSRANVALEENLTSVQWPMLWHAVMGVLRVQSERDRHVSRALHRLCSARAQDGWSQIFNVLHEAAPDALTRPDVLGSVDLWLSKPCASGGDWRKIFNWRMTVAPSPWNDTRIRARMTAWLMETDTKTPSWSSVCSNVVAHLPEADRGPILIRLHQWMEANWEASPSWPFIWPTVWKLEAANPQTRKKMRLMGLQWLERYPGRKGAWLLELRLRPKHARRA